MSCCSIRDANAVVPTSTGINLPENQDDTADLPIETIAKGLSDIFL